MAIEKFVREQYVNAPIEKVWAFFSNADNLAIITPPKLNLKPIHTDLPKEVHAGQKIIYKVTPLLGIPMKWVTEITEVRECEMFADEQKKGPYKYWRHEHYFRADGSGTMMTDIVHYELPGYLPSILATLLGIKKKIEEIFIYRKIIIDKIF